jgi:hypothetical protein
MKSLNMSSKYLLLSHEQSLSPIEKQLFTEGFPGGENGPKGFRRKWLKRLNMASSRGPSKSLSPLQYASLDESQGEIRLVTLCPALRLKDTIDILIHHTPFWPLVLRYTKLSVTPGAPKTIQSPSSLIKMKSCL